VWLKPLSDEVLKAGEMVAVLESIMPLDQSVEFERDLKVNLAISLSGIERNA
jgi:twitching motility protein PilU